MEGEVVSYVGGVVSYVGGVVSYVRGSCELCSCVVV